LTPAPHIIMATGQIESADWLVECILRSGIDPVVMRNIALAVRGSGPAVLAREMGVTTPSISAIVRNRGRSRPVEERVAKEIGCSLARAFPEYAAEYRGREADEIVGVMTSSED